MRHTESYSHPGQVDRAFSSERVAAVQMGRKIADRMLEDPDLCLWIRSHFIQKRLTIPGAYEEFLKTQWAEEDYRENILYPNTLMTALKIAKYELLTPEEIIDLHKDRQGRRKESEQIKWTPELLNIIGDILDEPAVMTEAVDHNYLAAEFSRRTGIVATQSQVKKRLARLKLAAKENRELGAHHIEGRIAWTAKNDRTLQEIAEDPKARKRRNSIKYIIGKFAELTGKVLTKSQAKAIVHKVLKQKKTEQQIQLEIEDEDGMD